MQTLQQTLKIEETNQKDDMLEILSDKYCRSILESIMHAPKSVIEITSETKIPMSTVYRRIQTLHDNKLVATSGMITDDGKRLFMYKSKVRGIQSSFDNGQTEVELILN
ncbi:MAG: helix-turn-helix domain-containing protein [Nitrosopumilus sp.]|uniref:winged helix-turn-helix domain-containing protein n=1 Tax=Nitrosopumilus sp. TaxID=2024843 RepID=UPI00246FF199|nr:helix-turn-helix domain-containing protein [Nitrosopumilus sp.]MDH5432019.1 helix-turn-helix domain-containing protein [Nitrosopumilus sp.]